MNLFAQDNMRKGKGKCLILAVTDEHVPRSHDNGQTVDMRQGATVFQCGPGNLSSRVKWMSFHKTHPRSRDLQFGVSPRSFSPPIPACIFRLERGNSIREVRNCISLGCELGMTWWKGKSQWLVVSAAGEGIHRLRINAKPTPAIFCRFLALWSGLT